MSSSVMYPGFITHHGLITVCGIGLTGSNSRGGLFDRKNR